MKKYFKFIILISLVCLTVMYTYYVRPLLDDELYNYGYSVSILNGLVPYKDFNMIIPPLFHYLLASVLFIFGKKLIVYHIVIAIIITYITYISYKKINKFSIIIYILLLVYPYTGYNMFCLFLLFFLLNLKENKYSIILEPIIISMMILSKHTLGLLIIPSLIYSKNKKKTFSVYLTSGLLFLLYLVLNNSLFKFLDYAVFGMFDFTNQNSTGFNILMIVELLIIGLLIYFTKKTKRKDIFYILVFQIIAFPIVNYIHFIISFIPVIYLLIQKFSKNNYAFILLMTTVLSFFLTQNFVILVKDNNYLLLGHYQIDNFMKDRLTHKIASSYIPNVKRYLDNHVEYTPYIFGNFSYLIKLNNEIPLNKYDNINNGNMGYHGVLKYLKEIDENCKINKCIFIMNDEEYRTKTNQTNTEILGYVQQNYMKKYSSSIFSVYTN